MTKMAQAKRSEPTAFHQLFTSPTLIVIAGPERKRLQVHEAVFRNSSSPKLQALVSGRWKGSQSEIDWSKENLQTVEAALSFLYKEDYDVADPNPCSPVQSEKPEKINKRKSTDQETGDASTSNPSAAKRVKLSEGTMFTFTLPQESSSTSAGRFATANFDPAQYRFGNVLLSHARLYIFAQYHLIEDLKTLALQRLHQVLISLTVVPAHVVSDLVDLFELVYASEALDDKAPIKTLCVQFASQHMSSFKGPDFERLLNNGSQFTVELFYEGSQKCCNLKDDVTKVCQFYELARGKVKNLDKELNRLNDQAAEMWVEIDAYRVWRGGSQARPARWDA